MFSFLISSYEDILRVYISLENIIAYVLSFGFEDSISLKILRHD